MSTITTRTPWQLGFVLDAHVLLVFVIPDLENTSYTRIANYLERQARQRGYQLLIACSEDQPDNEMRCIEHLLQRQVDAIIVSTSLPPEHPFYQRWANDPFPIVALDRALDREHFTSVVGADQDDAEMLAEELRKFSRRDGALSWRAAGAFCQLPA
ncbi:transcriptional regulator of the control of carbon and energy metabolism GalR/LacI family [Escherichia coli]|uniref:Transcriptional regulator of the control of carbon and energy metabolism GalR/LacI family n=1 Tax=Escherichia coli TaxID=562 RepID=A0A484YIA4_ECOLX|nr:transcriptional regulator of the control of carbon and energy metabolism GalR/LacI family [Escherichia coli]